jgi:spermidine export protein MdtI
VVSRATATALGGLLLFGERLRPVGWLGMMVMAVAVALLTTA